jgi:hypothetical protein
MPTKLHRAILEAALIGIDAQKQKLDERAAEIRQMLGDGPNQAASPTSDTAPRRRRTLSAEARKRIAQAQKARWAKFHGESRSAKSTIAPTAKPKRKFSPAAKAKLVANLKKARAAKAAKAKA